MCKGRREGRGRCVREGGREEEDKSREMGGGRWWKLESNCVL